MVAYSAVLLILNMSSYKELKKGLVFMYLVTQYRLVYSISEYTHMGANVQ